MLFDTTVEKVLVTCIPRELLRAFAIAEGGIEIKHTTFRDLESGPVIGWKGNLEHGKIKGKPLKSGSQTYYYVVQKYRSTYMTY